VFGVRQEPETEGLTGRDNPWPRFWALLEALRTRSITGHAARDAIEELSQDFDSEEWNGLCRRVIIKDLRCGVTEKTINKVLKAHPHIAAVPVFECQLAHDGANHPNKIAGPKLLEHKIDGVRVLTIIDRSNNTVTQLSRNGKPLDNFGHVTAQLQSVIDQFTQSVVLDGEIMSSNFQALMKQVQRKSDVNAQDAVLMLFDMIPLADFRRGRSPQTQKQRSAQLTKLKPVFDQLSSIQIIEQTLVNFDEYVGQLQFEDYNRQAIEQGLEGIMIKDPQAPYECKRTHHWLKIKPFVEVSLEIVETEQGTGRNENRLGALICQGTDGGHQIRVNVGSGFTDQQRDEIWQSRDTLIGQIVEVRADAITQNQDAIDTWSLRFPRFVKFRGFTAGQKI
jgi:DNA ligase-1